MELGYIHMQLYRCTLSTCTCISTFQILPHAHTHCTFMHPFQCLNKPIKVHATMQQPKGGERGGLPGFLCSVLESQPPPPPDPDWWTEQERRLAAAPSPNLWTHSGDSCQTWVMRTHHGSNGNVSNKDTRPAVRKLDD